MHEPGNSQEKVCTLGSMVSKVFPLCASTHSPLICEGVTMVVVSNSAYSYAAVSVAAPSAPSLRVADEQLGCSRRPFTAIMNLCGVAHAISHPRAAEQQAR